MSIDIQGHRGCRGIMPENTIEGFLKAIDLGVDTLEMDAVVSREQDIIISHEPFMSHEIAIAPDNHEITSTSEKQHNVYKMDYEQIKAYDTGSKHHKRFPDQYKLATHKPTLAAVVSAVDKRLAESGKSSIQYNIEIKRRTEWDYVYHPPYQEFADILVREIHELGIAKDTTIQCFDIATLQYVKRKYPNESLVFLVENKETPESNIAQLGFTPHIYSPDFQLVDAHLVNYCNSLGMKLIPWTVNELSDISAMVEYKVTGIISDYPDRVIKLLSSKD